METTSFLGDSAMENEIACLEGTTFVSGKHAAFTFESKLKVVGKVIRAAS